MNAAIIYCPHLNRDIRGLLNVVPNPQIWTGEKTERGEDGCLECHQAIVRDAKDKGWPMVFVMEDDCHFSSHFSWQRWQWTAKLAQAKHYDVLVGGCTRTYNERIAMTTEHGALLELGAFHSAHCIVYFQSGYDIILKTTQPHDLLIGQLGAKCLLTWPFVAVQRAVFSGILRQEVDYTLLYEAHEQRLGHALGLLEPMIPMPAVY
jgi:hypothetical protein